MNGWMFFLLALGMALAWLIPALIFGYLMGGVLGVAVKQATDKASERP